MIKVQNNPVTRNGTPPTMVTTVIRLLWLTLVTKMQQILDWGSRITLTVEGGEEAGTIEDLIVVSTIVEVEVMAVQEAMDMDMDMVTEEVIITMVTAVGVGNKTKP